MGPNEIAEVGVGPAEVERARIGLQALFNSVGRMYTCGATGSVSMAEGYGLVSSIFFVLGIPEDETYTRETVELLGRPDLAMVFRVRRSALDARARRVAALVNHVNETMPPIPSPSLRDTLSSLRGFAERYDTTFAAHEVPADIDYQLSEPISEELKGIDYVEAWLAQAQREADALAAVGLEECVRRLEARLPSYEDLNVNLYDLVLFGR